MLWLPRTVLGRSLWRAPVNRSVDSFACRSVDRSDRWTKLMVESPKDLGRRSRVPLIERIRQGKYRGLAAEDQPVMNTNSHSRQKNVQPLQASSHSLQWSRSFGNLDLDMRGVQKEMSRAAAGSTRRLEERIVPGMVVDNTAEPEGAVPTEETFVAGAIEKRQEVRAESRERLGGSWAFDVSMATAEERRARRWKFVRGWRQSGSWRAERTLLDSH